MKVYAKIELIGDDGKLIDVRESDVIDGVKWRLVTEVFDTLWGAMMSVKASFSMFEERPAA